MLHEESRGLLTIRTPATSGAPGSSSSGAPGSSSSGGRTNRSSAGGEPEREGRSVDEKALRWEALRTVMNFDRAQGETWDVVIVDAAEIRPRALEFAEDPARMTVALSRAGSLIVVIAAETQQGIYGAMLGNVAHSFYMLHAHAHIPARVLDDQAADKNVGVEGDRAEETLRRCTATARDSPSVYCDRGDSPSMYQGPPEEALRRCTKRRKRRLSVGVPRAARGDSPSVCCDSESAEICESAGRRAEICCRRRRQELRRSTFPRGRRARMCEDVPLSGPNLPQDLNVIQADGNGEGRGRGPDERRSDLRLVDAPLRDRKEDGMKGTG